MDTKPSRYARPQVTAQHFKIGKSTLWAWAKSRPGFPQPIKAGPRVTLFDLDLIDAFIAAQRKDSGGARPARSQKRMVVPKKRLCRPVRRGVRK